MLLIAGEDLLARVQLEALDRLGDPLGRARRQRHVGAVAAEELRVAPPQTPAQLRAALEVGRGPALDQLTLELLRGGLGRPRRQRPVGARVQVRESLEHGKL